MFRSFPRKRESREIPLGALGLRFRGDERKGDPVRPEHALVLLKTPPPARTAAFDFGKSPGEMALIDEPARQGYLGQREARVVQEPLCLRDAPHRKPGMWRCSGGLLERLG